MSIIQTRYPSLAQRLLQSLEESGPHISFSAREALNAVAQLAASGLQASTFSRLAKGLRPQQLDDLEFGDFQRGWQRVASAPVEYAELENLSGQLSDSSRTLLLS